MLTNYLGDEMSYLQYRLRLEKNISDYFGCTTFDVDFQASRVLPAPEGEFSSMIKANGIWFDVSNDGSVLVAE